ncbi:MAG: accessory factor UbiK family protein [Gammaproteobacteria bacterium]|nr:accessory factor UbiK family protein [Gammaproteobacteria bacterium]
MIKQEKIEDFFQEFSRLLPDDLRRFKKDADKNLKAAMTAAFARMDLVTREEFDIQSALLSKTRLLVEQLKQKLNELESKQE